MASKLRDIPGANVPKRRFVRSRDPFRSRRASVIDMTRRPLRLERPARIGLRPRRRVDVGLLVIVLGALGLAGWLLVAFWGATRVDVEMSGLEDGAALTLDDATALQIAIELGGDDDLHAASLRVDGVDVSRLLDRSGRRVVVSPAQLVENDLVPGALEEGEHEVELRVPRLFLGDARFRWSYRVDATAPWIDVPSAVEPVPIDEPLTLTGAVEPGTLLLVDGELVPTDAGRFSLDFDYPPARPLELVVVDEAGNRSAQQVTVPVVYPSGTAAVHVSAAAWRHDGLRQGVIDLIERGLVNAVQLDLKDESGVIGYDSDLPLAREIGAVRPEYRLEEAVEELEALGVRVIGRIVAFRDPVYAKAMWERGERDQVVQTPSGAMLPAYGGFTNYVHPEVRRYNIDIALEAVSRGVDDILWDYVRRPDGDPATMVVPGLGDSTSSVEVAEFMAESHEALRAAGAYQGASVFGIAAARPDAIAQHVPTLARHVEYLAPMIYPSHWVDGEYRVASPIRQPYDITYAALADFQRVAEGTGVRFVPWIQDFTHRGVVYGPAEVRAQIDAAADLGIDSYIVWNASVRYQADGLPGVR